VLNFDSLHIKRQKCATEHKNVASKSEVCRAYQPMYFPEINIWLFVVELFVHYYVKDSILIWPTRTAVMGKNSSFPKYNIDGPKYTSSNYNKRINCLAQATCGSMIIFV
jgi:hypothetical protein